MQIDNRQELLDLLVELVDSTRKGNHVWKPINATTYTWEDKPTRLVLQVSQKTILEGLLQIRRSIAFLEAFELKGEEWESSLRIDGGDDTELNEGLLNLFFLAKSGLTEKGLHLLKGIVHRGQVKSER